jgi:hypothetical protein
MVDMNVSTVEKHLWYELSEVVVKIVWHSCPAWMLLLWKLCESQSQSRFKWVASMLDMDASTLYKHLGGNWETRKRIVAFLGNVDAFIMKNFQLSVLVESSKRGIHAGHGCQYFRMTFRVRIEWNHSQDCIAFLSNTDAFLVITLRVLVSVKFSMRGIHAGHGCLYFRMTFGVGIEWNHSQDFEAFMSNMDASFGTTLRVLVSLKFSMRGIHAGHGCLYCRKTFMIWIEKSRSQDCVAFMSSMDASIVKICECQSQSRF